MIVVSMNDFLGNPAQYVEKAQYTSVLIESTGADPIILSVKKSIFSVLTRLFSSKARKIARDQRDLECINKNAEYLNKGAEENLEFQVDLCEDE